MKKLPDQKVLVKIDAFPLEKQRYFEISDVGVQVEMTEKDRRYVSESFNRYEKAQKILKEYYSKA